VRERRHVLTDDDAVNAAVLLAVDPIGLGGIAARARSGPARDAWLALLRHVLPQGVKLRRLPPQTSDDRLLGGLDLAATLRAGRPIAERGILAEMDGGVLLVPLAERLPTPMAARIAAALDLGGVRLERDGIVRQFPTRFGVVLLDESLDEEEGPPKVLLDRLACHVAIDAAVLRASEDVELEAVETARAILPSISVSDDVFAAICATAAALGVTSLNAAILAARVARAAAALRGEQAATEADVAIAARLVLAPRATLVPMMKEESDPPADQEEAKDDQPEDPTRGEAGTLEERVLAAAEAAIPPHLLARMQGAGAKPASSTQGRVGRPVQGAKRGRSAGTRKGDLRRGARLHVLETLRAAAPWQRLRASMLTQSTPRKIEVRADDFRIRRFKQRSETVTIFVVDASGSSALHRLGEAKGAVELLLADCYVRRDQVALLAFGGRGPELILPPTRSLTRAKRRLADLPGGGGTPLGAALDAAALMAHAVKRKGQTPAIVVLTDGRPNLARDGGTGRDAGEADAIAAGRDMRASRFAALLIDTSKRPEPGAARIANAMGAQYVPLPYADARSLSEEVRMRMPGHPK
jgi:magnesium chelatase subunit D